MGFELVDFEIFREYKSKIGGKLFGRRSSLEQKVRNVACKNFFTDKKDWRNLFSEYKKKNIKELEANGYKNHYLSGEFMVSSNNSSIVVDNGDTKTFISSISRDRLKRPNGRNKLEVHTMSSKVINSASFKIKPPKTAKKLKPSQSFVKRDREKRHILTREQKNIIEAAKTNNHTYLNRIKGKRELRDFTIHDKKFNCALYYAVSKDNYESAEVLINQSECD
jgi:hypothetical protein